MKTLKRISAMLLAVMLIASFTVAAFAENNVTGELSVNSDEVDTNTGYIWDNSGTINVNLNNGSEVLVDTESLSGGYLMPAGTVEENKFIITTNHGQVAYNYGTVSTNAAADETAEKPAGIVYLNEADGKVNNNCGEVTDNYGKVTTNNGTVVTNLTGGTVEVNATAADGKPAGVVETNNGTVVVNQAGGTIKENNGDVGIITHSGSGVSSSNYLDGSGNFGTIEINGKNACVSDNGGNITNNDGLIITNLKNGTVLNNNEGSMILFNEGTVENNSGNVLNYADGKVINNFNDGSDDYQGTVTGTSAQHQFSNYAEITTDGCDAEKYETAGAVTEYDGKYWAEADKESTTPATKEGSVTVTLSESYDNISTSVNEKEGYNFSVSGSGKNWTLTFTQLLKNIKITITGSNNSTPTPDPKPDPKPTPAGPVAVFSYKLVFDLDGGVMPDGKTELELKCSAGQHIKLPEAPTREGFTFVGWQTEIRGKTVILDAGAKFTVTAAKTFVALWEEN